MRIRMSSWLVLGLLAAVAPQARGASLDVHGYTLGERVQVHSPVRSGWVNTAELSASLDGVLGVAFCVDLAQTIGIGDHAVTVQALGSLPGTFEAAYLVNTWYPYLGGLGDHATAITALQLAIWEVRYETSGSYGLGNGLFSVASASGTAIAMAERMLGALPAQIGATPGFSIAYSPKVQDQIWMGGGAPIPEPGSALLFFGGALALSMLSRRTTTS